MSESPDDLVLEACALLIRGGSIERAERELSEIMTAAKDEIRDIVGEAQVRIVTSAPREIRQSFEMVVSWHRWNHMYQWSMQRGEVKNAMVAQKRMDELMMGVH